MEPRFEVPFTINRDLMKIFAGYSSARWAFRLRRILFLVLGCLELFLASLSGFHSILPVIIGVLSLLLAVFYSQYLQWWYWRRNKPKAGTAVVYTFFEDRFTAVSGTLSQSAQYDDLFEVVETKAVFGLRRDKSGAAILPKSCFTVGSPDDFRAFIEEKTGKKIKFIR
ncbi:MAG: YcxB family protein [Clostridia bacterium]|nr:YcxB family protein [Clostridia bacterium]